MPKQLDAALIAKAMAGDRQSFRHVVETYQGFLYGVAYRYLANEADAEDAVQETFVKLWKNFSKYRPEIKLSTWLYRILVNHCLDHKKSSSHRSKSLQASYETSLQQGGIDTPLNELTGKELAHLHQLAIEQLIGKQKMIYVLRDMEDLNPTEICQLMSINEDQVKSNLYHARKKVQEFIKKHYCQ
jgi:RNA polymerase sigma-70 factor (ECF subfamily)